ncbi:MAG TPA: VanW family protein, partial [Fimbriimonas sp.]|nr:VanW family protein [Fimbriimonas sp.]
SSNIRLASSKINGALLMPGEKWGFNEYVGRRTTQAGYREAGVYINGRHDTGVGGGICQVSTTLYNAALFANLKIVERTNHSLPVPYVPLGRDATVNWGAQNLVLENNTGAPIAIVSTYEPGRLTFRILGKKDPTLSVKVTQGKIRYWSGSTRREYDPRLAPGATKVVSTGSNKGVAAFRHIYRNGVKEKTEDLGYSAYTGGGTVILYGPKAPAKPKAPAAPAAGAPVTTPPPASDPTGPTL